MAGARTDRGPAALHPEPDSMTTSQNDGAWHDRLSSDSKVLAEQLTDAQDTAVKRILDTADESGDVDFLVVYGSVSRGEQHPGSDLDVYYETDEASAAREEADPTADEHVFAAASGSLVEALRCGDEMAFEMVSDALVVHDDGAFRSTVVAAEQEHLEPAS